MIAFSCLVGVQFSSEISIVLLAVSSELSWRGSEGFPSVIPLSGPGGPVCKSFIIGRRKAFEERYRCNGVLCTLFR